MIPSLLLLVSLCSLGYGDNIKPVIGIIAQHANHFHRAKGDTFVNPNYVKFLEQAGALVVPIRLKEPLSYYQDLFGKINGILYPGGHLMDENSATAYAAELLYNMAVTANDNGDFFPLFGIAKGHQLLSYLSTHHRLVRDSPVYNKNLPLVFEPDFRESRMLKDMPEEMVEVLRNHSITPNVHHNGITLSTYEGNAELKSFYRVISTNTDDNGNDFISTMEGFTYPFYGLQWNVEKLLYDWIKDYVVHSYDGVRVCQYFANFFVNEARKNHHTFKNNRDMIDHLIQNVQLDSWNASTTVHYNYYLNYTNHYTVVG